MQGSATFLTQETGTGIAAQEPEQQGGKLIDTLFTDNKTDLTEETISMQ